MTGIFNHPSQTKGLGLTAAFCARFGLRVPILLAPRGLRRCGPTPVRSSSTSGFQIRRLSAMPHKRPACANFSACGDRPSARMPGIQRHRTSPRNAKRSWRFHRGRVLRYGPIPIGVCRKTEAAWHRLVREYLYCCRSLCRRGRWCRRHCGSRHGGRWTSRFLRWG